MPSRTNRPGSDPGHGRLIGEQLDPSGVVIGAARRMRRLISGATFGEQNVVRRKASNQLAILGRDIGTTDGFGPRSLAQDDPRVVVMISSLDPAGRGRVHGLQPTL